MATAKKSKKAQYGEYLTQDRGTGKYTLTTKANTPGVLDITKVLALMKVQIEQSITSKLELTLLTL